MGYTIKELSDLSGVSPRTLRYYEKMGLLSPTRNSSGYRVYGKEQVDILQQVLFFRRLGLSLEQTADALSCAGFRLQDALQKHLSYLYEERERLDQMIRTVQKTIRAQKREITMTDREKFEGFKQELLAEQKKKYGAEAEALYGKETVEQTDERWLKLGEEEYRQMEQAE